MAYRHQYFKVTMFLTSFICNLLVGQSAKPVDIARKVGNAFLVNELTFVNWEGGFQYGPAIVVDGLYETLEMLDESTKKSWESQLSQILNHYYNTDCKITIPCNQTCPYGKCLKFRSCAYDILKSNMSLSDSIFRNVGDLMNLFPIGYLRRYNLNNELYVNDLEVAKIAVKKYILPFPLRTFDGTFSRQGGFNFETFTAHNNNENYIEKNIVAPFLWADDQFMGLTLIARLSTTDASSISTEERFELVNFISEMQLRFINHIYDHEHDGLIYHGTFLNQSMKKFSCCKWGRANGWGAMSHMEVLKSMEQFPRHPNRMKILQSYRTFIDSMLRFQDQKTGRWHQVINETSTYLETSVTAMMVTAMATGIKFKWLISNKNSLYNYTDVTLKAWNGLVSQITNNGTVNGVCMGTGIQDNFTQYNERGTDYWQSSPGGVGVVLRASVAIKKMLET
jgi:rhamnogalacturonyl hydrolase YesR